jgi:ADP-heptose:LPS heptosyltransferase
MPSIPDQEKLREPKPQTWARRILVFYPRRIGDWVVLTPFLRSLRWKFPQAEITAVASFRSAAVLPLISFCDHFHVLGPPQDLKNLRLLRFFLMAEPWDLLIDLDPNPAFSRTGWTALRLTRARARMSFARPGTKSFAYLVSPPVPNEAMLARYGRMAEFLGAPYDPSPELRVPQSEIESAGREMHSLGLNDHPRVLIHPGDLKREQGIRWPRKKFAVLGRKLNAAGVRFFFLAGPGERESVARLAQDMGINSPIIIGPRPLVQAAAFMRHADLFLSSLTGTSHVAAALGVPTFSFYTGYDWQVWRIHGKIHRGLIGEWEDCRSIEIDQAHQAIIDQLGNLGRKKM